MLIGKLTPSASFLVQDGPFNTKTQTADYMSAYLANYTLGSPTATFRVMFHNLVDVTVKELQKNMSGKDVLVDVITKSLEMVNSSHIELTADEIATWGADDATGLIAIANKLGVQVSDFQTI